VSGSGG